MSDDVFARTASRVVEDIERESLTNGGDSNVDNLSEDVSSQIEYLSGFDPNFKNSQEYKDLIASARTESNQASDDEDEDEDEEEDDDEDSDDELEDEDDDEEEEEEDDDIFGLKKTINQKKIKINFDAPKEMLDLISSKFGVKDAETFFNSVSTWRTQAQESDRVKKENTALLSDIEAMPPEIKRSITLWAKGDDFLKPFTENQRLNFSESFAKQDKEKIVQHYHLDAYNKLLEKFDNDKLTEEELEDRIELLAETAEKLFDRDKKALEKEREDFTEKQKNEFRLMKKSATFSVEKLSKTFPNFRTNELNKIRGILVDGRIDDLFYNEDGQYAEDAAERVAYALFGSKIKGTIENVGKRKGESEANIKYVDTSPKSIKKRKSSSEGRDRVDMSSVNHLSGMFKSDPYA